MGNKKIRMYFIIIFIILIILGIGYLIYININYEKNNNIEEFIPEIEITDEQMRETIISLFFKNDADEIVEESRQVDSKKLLNEPYKYLIELLINGPENEKYIRIIPEDTKIEEINFEKGIIYLKLINEKNKFENNKNMKDLFLKSIKATLQQFNEIKEIKIFFNGEEI